MKHQNNLKYDYHKMKEYKYFKTLIILVSVYILFLFCKNYFIINYTNKINYKLVDINKYWDKHSYRSDAKLLIDNNVHVFEVQAQFFDVYKETGKIDFNLYYDFVLKKYLTTADYYFSRNFLFLMIIINLFAFSDLSKKVIGFFNFLLSGFINKLNKVFP